mmetsp:Transcript_31796/g.38438  ORF Transcript_31796/g.38438 Transcript_31796/m.38438 type:complete len:477 (-) Transcript_31796:588-2018(-)
MSGNNLCRFSGLALLSVFILSTSFGIDAATASSPKKAPIVLSVGRGEGSRGLLPSAALKIHGGGLSTGYFYAKVKLGSPSQDFEVILDTGSGLLYVPCSGCGKRCGKHQDSYFKSEKSTTYSELSCTDEMCDASFMRCKDNKCKYDIKYAEESSSEGKIVKDLIHLPSLGAMPVVFGCESSETGLIHSQKADGVMGLDASEDGIITQLTKQGVIDDVLSFCIGGEGGEHGGGAFFLGHAVLPPGAPDLVEYADLVPHPRMANHYVVHLNGLKLGEEDIEGSEWEFNEGYGTVIDTGTTFLYMHEVPYKSFMGALDKAVKSSHLRLSKFERTDGTTCFTSSETMFPETLEMLFPHLTLNFKGASLKVPPQNYLFVENTGELCVGVFSQTSTGVIVGSTVLRNVLTIIDREHGHVGFVPEIDCNEVTKSSEAASKGRKRDHKMDELMCGPGGRINKKGVCQWTHATGASPHDNTHQDL